MKKVVIVLLLPLVLGIMGCTRPCCDVDDVVVETYVHKYGVEVPADDWTSRGENGQVISTLSNGVKIKRSYLNGALDDETTYSFPHSDTIEKIETYRQGVLVKETVNNSLGAPLREISYQIPTHKRITTWYDNGSPQKEEEYEGNLLISGSYFTRNNQLESRVDDREGIRTQRDAYGQLLSTDTISNGEMTMQVTYYSNGVPKAKTPYRFGFIEGKQQTFLPSGEPNTLEEWVAGKQHGMTIVYRNGERFAEVPYANGQKEGLERHFRDESKVVEEITWNHNQKHGPSYAYIENTTKADWYFKDRLVTKATFDQMTRPAK